MKNSALEDILLPLGTIVKVSRNKILMIIEKRVAAINEFEDDYENYDYKGIYYPDENDIEYFNHEGIEEILVQPILPGLEEKETFSESKTFEEVHLPLGTIVCLDLLRTGEQELFSEPVIIIDRKVLLKDMETRASVSMSAVDYTGRSFPSGKYIYIFNHNEIGEILLDAPKLPARKE